MRKNILGDQVLKDRVPIKGVYIVGSSFDFNFIMCLF